MDGPLQDPGISILRALEITEYHTELKFSSEVEW